MREPISVMARGSTDTAPNVEHLMSWDDQERMLCGAEMVLLDQPRRGRRSELCAECVQAYEEAS
jgi:hypothetical protein